MRGNSAGAEPMNQLVLHCAPPGAAALAAFCNCACFQGCSFSAGHPLVHNAGPRYALASFAKARRHRPQAPVLLVPRLPPQAQLPLVHYKKNPKDKSEGSPLSISVSITIWISRCLSLTHSAMF